MNGGLADVVAAEGYCLHMLPPGQENPDQDGPTHAHWLEASSAEDADATLRAIHAGPRPDWLVVDHYALDQRWESAMRGAVGRIAVIDDLADRLHDCDLLIDQNLGAEMKGYNRLVGNNSRLLLSPSFALLRPEFASARFQRNPENRNVYRLLVSFGGSDSAGLTTILLWMWWRGCITHFLRKLKNVLMNCIQPISTSRLLIWLN
jgi:spore coat polysaccharide biosynthesis predicted glycosyltransferase SpsG